MKLRTPNWLLRRTAWGAAVCALSLTACSQDENNMEVSEAARETALATTQQIVDTDQVMQSAKLVEDLTGGFDQGLAGEDLGLDMELGGELGTDGEIGDDATLGYVIASAGKDLKVARKKLAQWQISQQGKDAHTPGELLFEDIQDNVDGSRVRTAVYQDDPEAVVRVVQETTWPNGNLLLDAINNEIFVDRGADFESEEDDTWLSLASELVFRGGQRLARNVDARAQGGLQDDLRIDVISSFTPRPNHPRLVGIESTITVDLHSLEDEADDRFVSVSRTTELTGTAHDGGAPRVEEMIAPENPMAEGEEPCGGEGSRDIYFENSSSLVSLQDRASWACAGGGSLSRTVEYDDQSSDSMTLSQDAEGVVTMNASGRDGGSVTGTFDESAGTFQIDVAYPNGHDPVSRSLSGTSNADGTDWSLDETVTYADEFVEQNHLEGSEDEDGKSLSGSHDGRDESVEFSLATNADETVLEGHIENDRGESVEFRAEELADGGRLLDFTLINPTTRVVGHVEVGADGCGTIDLEITEGDARSTIHSEFCEDGLNEDDFLAGN